MLVCEEPAGSPHPYLHFVENEYEPFPVAYPPHLPEIFSGRDVYPPLPLDRLQHDRAGGGGDRRGQSLRVIERDMLETVKKGVEEPLHLLLAGCGDCRHRPAVKRVGSGDDLITLGTVLVAAVFPGQLDGRLVRLCPAVAEEGLVRKGVAAQQFGQFDLLRYLVVVGTVYQTG
jgi:hypothetical protein